MPELNKVLLAHALALGFDGTTEIEVIFRKPGEKMAVIFDGVKQRPPRSVEPMTLENSSEMERRVLAVVGKLKPGESMNAKEIAKQANYRYSGGFRQLLSRMRNDKKIKKISDGQYGPVHL